LVVGSWFLVLGFWLSAVSFQLSLLVPVRDSSLGHVVGAEFDGHLVAREDPDEELAHLSADVGEDFLPVLEPDAEPGGASVTSASSVIFSSFAMSGYRLC
jgi:hypothetical protein